MLLRVMDYVMDPIGRILERKDILINPSHIVLIEVIHGIYYKTTFASGNIINLDGNDFNAVKKALS